MGTGLYWLEGPWRGRLALSARPRGGDWLGDEMARWKRVGVSTVLSLLTPEEEQDLDLLKEASEAKLHALDFISFPIPDRHVPQSETQLAKVLEDVARGLSAGKDVVIHCRQGVGRSGLVAACLLVGHGMSPGAAVEAISAARGVAVPETVEQREWIDHYATALSK